MQVALLSILIALTAFEAQAFEETFQRYFTGTEIIRHLDHSFPEGKPSRGSMDECYVLGKSLELVGTKRPLTGEILSKRPGPLFLNWYTTCIKKRIYNSLAFARPRYFIEIPKEPVWKNNPEASRHKWIRYWIHLLIGPSIVKNEDQLITLYDQKMADPNKYITVDDATKTILYSIALRDEFMTY